MTVTLFIDTNQYLRLYETISGKKLLAALEEQRSHIFVSRQVVNEVYRNKLGCAAKFLNQQLKDVPTSSLPDHLLGVSTEKLNEFRTLFRTVKDAMGELSSLFADVLRKISDDEDEVSVRLASVFESARNPTDDNLRNARLRRELGNPPGYFRDPLGDQLTWEQLLDHCQATSCRKLWLITGDNDYVTKFGKQLIPNPILRRDLDEKVGRSLELFCFDSLLEGIQHFAANAGVSANNLPNAEDAAEIKKELEQIPFGWAMGDADAALLQHYAARRRAYTDVSGRDMATPFGPLTLVDPN